VTQEEFERQMTDLNKQLQDVQTKSVAVVPDKINATPEWWTTQNAMTMSTVVLLFGIVVIAICAVLMRGSRPSAEAVLRVFGTVLIIVGALFLVVAGYTDKQMAPVMGLLGTLAGYLLGKSPTEKDRGGEKNA
jgi:drug/metabolite transporter superfamily protein YnfA